jgi:hypothetical protein
MHHCNKHHCEVQVEAKAERTLTFNQVTNPIPSKNQMTQNAKF